MELPKSGFFSTVFSALLFRPVIRRLDAHASPKYCGSLTLAGLRETVTIFFDSHAIPHVKAANENDLFFAQGYLHAQERLWQMEMSRRFLDGRMAEIFGNFPLPWRDLSAQFRGRNSVDFDYFIRLLGIRHAAASSAALCTETEWQRLRSYSDGVNAYIEKCGKKLPWEFRLLRHEPEPWSPQDSLTIAKGLAFLLSTALYTRLNFMAVAARLADQPDKLRALLPSYPENGPPITQAVWNQMRSIWEFSAAFAGSSDWHPAGHGSNNWVIAPNRSATGGALLCNDPHLRLTLPSIWYLIHLRAERRLDAPEAYEVWGASIPGIPFIHLGHNRRIAWGITASLCDDVEIYSERLHPVESDRYLRGHRWESIQSQTERIGVRWQSAKQRTVRSTHHGPIISDFSDSLQTKSMLSIQWTAHEATREFRSLYGVNCAHTWNEFLESLSHHVAPALNFVYADDQGNIGYTLAGKVPIRSCRPSLLPVEGWHETSDWQGYVPFEQLPRVLNPPSGVIATANNGIVDASYPYYLSHFFEPPYRVRRIHQLLAATEKHTPQDMSRIQLDDLSLHAVALIAALSTELAQVPKDSPIVKTAANSLLAWDGTCAESSIEAAVFHVFHRRLLANLLSPTLGTDLFHAYVEILNQCITPTDRILADPHSAWFEKRPRRELVAASLRQACSELTELFGDHMHTWQWGKLHQLRLNHSLGRVGILKPLLGIGPMAAPGDGTTINLGFYRHSNPYQQTVGPSLRFVVDLKDWHNSGFVLPSGQSGHPLSTHYRDQTKLWRDGQTIHFSDSKPLPEGSRCLVLKPG